MRISFDASGWGTRNHAVSGKRFSNNGICSDNTMLPKSNSWHNGYSIANKTMLAYSNRAFALEWLQHNQTIVRIHAMAKICDVYVFAQDAAVSDHDGIHRREIDMSSDIDIIPYRDARAIRLSGIFCYGVEVSVSQHDGSFPNTNTAPCIDSVWAMYSRCFPYRDSAWMIAKICGDAF